MAGSNFVDYVKIFANSSKAFTKSGFVQEKKGTSSSRIIRGIEEYIAEGAIVTDSADVVLESGKYIIQNEFSF